MYEWEGIAEGYSFELESGVPLLQESLRSLMVGGRPLSIIPPEDPNCATFSVRIGEKTHHPEIQLS